MEVLGLDKLLLVPASMPPHKALPEGGAERRRSGWRWRRWPRRPAGPRGRRSVTWSCAAAGASYTADTLAAAAPSSIRRTSCGC